MTGSHLYQHLTRGINKDTMSFYLDHQLLRDRRPKLSHYMKDIGTNLNTTPEQESLTSELNDSISTNSMERVSHRTANKHLNLQMENQQHQNQSQRTPATTNQCNAIHQQLSQSLHHQQHQSPATHTTEENPESYHSQTNTALASLLLARNNNRP